MVWCDVVWSDVIWWDNTNDIFCTVLVQVTNGYSNIKTDIIDIRYFGFICFDAEHSKHIIDDSNNTHTHTHTHTHTQEEQQQEETLVNKGDTHAVLIPTTLYTNNVFDSVKVFDTMNEILHKLGNRDTEHSRGQVHSLETFVAKNHQHARGRRHPS